jgi:lysophospholipase L1-like esterase
MAAPLPSATAIATAAPVLVTLGDSITAGAHGSEYPHKLGELIGAARVTNLGIGGEFSGPMNYTVRNGTHMVYGGVLRDQVGAIPLDATIVTLYIGTNDMWLAREKTAPDLSNIDDVYADAAKAYDANLKAIVSAVRRRAPLARIVVADVPNPANRPVHMAEKAAMRDAESLLADSMRSTILATGVTVVDLECDPAMYDDANFGGPYDVHPVDRGFKAIAADFANAILHGSTLSWCVYELPMPNPLRAPSAPTTPKHTTK